MLSLAPILWESGIGSDVMKPVAASIVGGMITSTIHVLIGGDMTIQSFVKANHHDHARLNRDSEECDLSDPHRDAEVEAHHVLKQEPAGYRVPGRKDQHDRFGY